MFINDDLDDEVIPLDVIPAEKEVDDLDDEVIPLDVIPAAKEVTELPTLRSFSALKAIDLLVEAGIASDEETLEFLVCNRVSQLWQACLNDDPAFNFKHLCSETGGTYFNEIRNRFLYQYGGNTSRLARLFPKFAQEA